MCNYSQYLVEKGIEKGIEKAWQMIEGGPFHEGWTNFMRNMV